jgi:hypothetical protein
MLNGWMSSYRLKLNDEHIQKISGSGHDNNMIISISVSYIYRGRLMLVPQNDVVVDRQLNMVDQVAALCRSGFF